MNHFLQDKERNLIKIAKLIGIGLTVALLFYIVHYGMSSLHNSLHQLIIQSGMWGPIIFILFQMLQVIIPILPGGISLTIGIISFGNTLGFFYNYIGIVIGSIISFLLIRKFGKPLIKTFVSEKNYQKYMNLLDNQKNFRRFFILALLFPIAPDDLLCMIAGLTKMKLRDFIIIIVFCKPLSIFLYGFGLTSLLNYFN